MSSEHTSQKIGDLDVEAFYALLVQAFEAATKAEGKLMHMTLPEFTNNMIEVFKSRAHQTAVAEAQIAQRVLTDWQGLRDVQAVAQPFRITNVEDLDAFYKNLRDHIDQGAGLSEFAVAVAIVKPTPATSSGVAYVAVERK